MNAPKNKFVILILLILVILLIPERIQAEEAKALFEVLKENDGLGKQIKDIWKVMINAVNSFVIVLLIVTAFSQILRLNINTYGIKKILPSLILAIIAANFSMLIMRLMIDISNVLTEFFLKGPSSEIRGDPDAVIGAFSRMGDLTLEGAKTAGDIFWFSLGQILVFVGAILILILAYLFIIRNWVIYFLIPLAPLAFMAMVLPQTKTVFNQWWSNFIKWVFMPVVSCFWLFLGGLWFKYMNFDTSFILSFAFAAVCYYLAITTPFKMGGAIMSGWANFGKKAAKLGYNQWGGSASRLSAIGERLAQRHPPGTRLGNFGRGMQKFGGAINIPASVRAYKQSRQEARENLDKAAKKTGTYNRLLGPRARFNALSEVFSDDYTQKSALATGRDQANMDNAIITALRGNPTSRQARLFLNNHRDIADIGLASDQALTEAIRSDLATMNGVKLIDSYAGLGGIITNDAETAVRAKLNTRRYNQLNNSRLRNDLHTNYIAVGGAGWAGTTAVGAGANQSINAVQTAIIQNGGTQEEAEKYARHAQYGTGEIPRVIVEKYGEEALTHMNNLRSGRDQLISQEFESRKNSINEDMIGLDLVLQRMKPHDGNREFLPDIKKEIAEAKMLMNSNDPRRVENAADKLKIVGPRAESDVLERIDHLEKGISHFTNMQSHLDSLPDPVARENERKSIIRDLQNNTGAYVENVRSQKEKAAMTEAVASSFAQIAMSNISSRKPESTIGDMQGPEGIDELTSAINGLQEHIKSSGGSGTSGIAQVARIDPIGMGSQQIIKDTLNSAIKEGMITATTRISDAMNNKRFIDTMSQSWTQAMKKTPLQVAQKEDTRSSSVPSQPSSTPPTTPPIKPNI